MPVKIATIRVTCDDDTNLAEWEERLRSLAGSHLIKNLTVLADSYLINGENVRGTDANRVTPPTAAPSTAVETETPQPEPEPEPEPEQPSSSMLSVYLDSVERQIATGPDDPTDLYQRLTSIWARAHPATQTDLVERYERIKRTICVDLLGIPAADYDASAELVKERSQ